MSNDNTVASATEVAPYAGSVLYLIYGVDGDGATSYEIDNGAVATFWAASISIWTVGTITQASPTQHRTNTETTKQRPFLIRASGCRLAKPRSC